MTETFYKDIAALHQTDVDMQKEALDEFKKTNNKEQFLEQQALIHAMFRQGMKKIMGADAPYPEPEET